MDCASNIAVMYVACDVCISASRSRLALANTRRLLVMAWRWCQYSLHTQVRCLSCGAEPVVFWRNLDIEKSNIRFFERIGKERAESLWVHRL